MTRSKKSSASATHPPAPALRPVANPGRGTNAGRSRTSAGLLMFRRAKDGIEVLLAHPGGPFFRKKDAGYWTVPKGEAGDGEDLLTRARIEFDEELGFAPPVPIVRQSGGPCAVLIPLGSVIQKGGKTVHAWAFEGDLPEAFELKSNLFEMEWPPRSGKTQSFPEVDRAQFFPLSEARIKLKPAQVPFLERLMAHLG